MRGKVVGGCETVAVPPKYLQSENKNIAQKKRSFEQKNKINPGIRLDDVKLGQFRDLNK
jgi:hypothetical protein